MACPKEAKGFEEMLGLIKSIPGFHLEKLTSNVCISYELDVTSHLSDKLHFLKKTCSVHPSRLFFFGISAAAKSFWPGGRKGESWPSYFLLIYSDAHRWTVAQKICKNQKIKKSTNIPVKDTKKHTHPTAVQRWGENIKARYLFSESSILLDVP